MKMSQYGLAMLTRLEGSRTTAYRDSIGVWTIGVGHTAMAGPPAPKAGMVITKDQVLEILSMDIVQYENAVLKVLKFQPTQNQFDAMVSLCFNIGPNNFQKSSLVRNFNAGNMKAAAGGFDLWTKAGGRVLPGLVSRRKVEKALFCA